MNSPWGGMDGHGGGGFLDDGDYEGVVTEIALIKNQARGLSVRIVYSIVNNVSGALNGMPVVVCYNIIAPEDGATEDLERLQRDISILGVEKHALNSLASKADFIELLNNLAIRRVWVAFRVETTDGVSIVTLLGLIKNQEYKPLLSSLNAITREDLVNSPTGFG